MTFNEYQEKARSTAIYHRLGENLEYPTLGLCGEAGEVAEKVKKIHRDDGGKCTPEKREALKSEIGDILWYCGNLAVELGLTLEEIAQFNVEKLASRQARGKLHGSGDNR
jgi:NTP pyrophosphatase (non-canonical NTP hydrolase)